ncbi:MAG: proton-conducting transporter membrane subunit, partial [Ktedonobacterales bacterium]
MPLSLLIGVLTLVPVLAALVIAGLGAVRRALAPAVFVLCVLGALVPIICLLLLAPYLSSGEPVRVTLFGGSLAASAWFSAVYRADPFGIYAGLGLAILVVPLLLWMAWKGRLSPVAPATATSDIVGAAPGDMDTENLDADDELTASPARPMLSLLPSTSWAGVALTLATETAALTILFADNILWLALAWLVLAALIWGIGELGAEKVDRAGLAFALAGPVLWAVGMLLGAVPAKAPALFNLMGRGAYSPLQVIVLALAIALAGGAYPFLTWVRRRATLATPAGLGALLLVALPITIFAAARTYSAAQDVTGQWTEIGQAAPPVYGGIAWAVLGAVTVAVCGLLALERRDGRTLLAYLGAAQVGWGMLALSTGDPASLAAIVLLLAGSIFGLGAMLAAMFAGATLTDDDEEPDSAGPRAFGTRFSAASLFAWCAGAVSLIGVPLFGGFAARELLSAAALHLGNLTVPLVAIAWAGDALLALALLRAIAPAFTQLAVDADALDIEDIEDIEDIKDGTDEETLAEVAANRLDDEEPGDAIDDENREVDENEESDEDETKVALRSGARRAPSAILRALPALVFGVLA